MSSLAGILGLAEDEPVLVSLGAWEETRAMQTADGACKFRQVRMRGRWVLSDLIDPPINEWYKVEATAVVLGMSVVAAAWTGPLDRIPQSLLVSDDTVMIRSKRKRGWINVKNEMREACEGLA